MSPDYETQHTIHSRLIKRSYPNHIALECIPDVCYSFGQLTSAMYNFGVPLEPPGQWSYDIGKLLSTPLLWTEEMMHNLPTAMI
jgi:hypothetical protein